MIFTFKCTCAGKSHLAMFDYRRYLSYNIIYISGGCSKSQNANFWKVNPLYPRCVYKYICTYIYIFIFYVHVHVHIYIPCYPYIYIYLKKKLFSWWIPLFDVPPPPCMELTTSRKACTSSLLSPRKTELVAQHIGMRPVGVVDDRCCLKISIISSN